MNVLLSIIMPIYNTKEYLNESLNSIINQSNRNFELILIDDGSTDDSLEYAKNILSTTNICYKLIKKKNGGVSSARNKGIDLAKGKYVLFLDSDDIIDLDLVKEIEKKELEGKYDLITFGYNKVSNNKVIWEYSQQYDYIEQNSNARQVLDEFLEYKIHLCVSNIVYLKSFLYNNELKYLLGCHNGEDQNFIIKSLIKSNSIGSIHKVLMSYNQRETSISYSTSIKRLTIIEAYQDLINYMLKNNLSQDLLNKIKYERFANNIITNLWYVASDKNNKKYIEDIYKDKFIKECLFKYKLNKFRQKELTKYLKIKVFIYFPNLFIYLSQKML